MQIELFQQKMKIFRRKCKELLKKKGINIVTGAKVLPETLLKDNGQVTISAEVKGENERI